MILVDKAGASVRSTYMRFKVLHLVYLALLEKDLHVCTCTYMQGLS